MAESNYPQTHVILNKLFTPEDCCDHHSLGVTFRNILKRHSQTQLQVHIRTGLSKSQLSRLANDNLPFTTMGTIRVREMAVEMGWQVQDLLDLFIAGLCMDIALAAQDFLDEDCLFIQDQLSHRRNVGEPHDE